MKQPKFSAQYVFSSRQQEKFTQNVWMQSLDSRKFLKPSLNFFNLDSCNNKLCTLNMIKTFNLNDSLKIEEKSSLNIEKNSHLYSKKIKLSIINDKNLNKKDFLEICNNLDVKMNNIKNNNLLRDNSQFLDESSIFINMIGNDKCEKASININKDDLEKFGTHTINFFDHLFLKNTINNKIIVEKASDYTNFQRPWYNRRLYESSG